MRTLIVSAAAVAALVFAAAAGAGGWATVGVTPLPSDDETVWTPTLKVLQHGVRPLDNVQPVITIRNGSTGESVTFTATATGKPGEYAARVEFPGPGVWEYTIHDGFSGTHTFKAVEIAAAGAVGSSTWIPWTVGGALALAAALALAVLLGRRARLGRTPVAAHE